jgi:hypothetical protein
MLEDCSATDRIELRPHPLNCHARLAVESVNASVKCGSRLLRPRRRRHAVNEVNPGPLTKRSYTQKLWMRVKRKAAYLPG